MNMRACSGVALASAKIAAVRAERSRSGGIIVKPLELDNSVGAGLGGIPAVGCISVNESLSVWIDAPFDSWSKNRRVLSSLLDARLPFPLEDCCFDFTAARRGPNGNAQILALAARRKNIEECLSRYRAAGAEPALLDHAGLALWTQCVREWPLPPQADRVVIHVQPETITAAFGRGSVFYQAHAVKSAPLTEMESVMLHLERMLFAAFGENCRPNWCLCAVNGADFADELLQRIETRWPGGKVWRPEDADNFLPRALAVRALTSGGWRCNLRSGELLHPAVLGWQRKTARRNAMLACAAGLALIAGNWRTQSALARRKASLGREIASLAAELAPDARIYHGREVAEARRALEAAQQAAAPLRAVLTADLPADIGRLTAAAAGAEAVFDTLRADREKFSVTGAAADWTQCEMLMREIESLGYDVRVESLPALDDGRAAFTATGVWN